MPELTTLASESSDEYGAGALIGDKYRLERPLGEGGQAFVWQARHVELDAPVAIKIAVGAGDEPERGARLLLEGRAVSKIGHPGITKVFDVGRTAAGDPYLVMELLEGETLLTALTRAGRLPPVETVRILLPIAHALAAAHAEGLVHRDVKPENVFLARTANGSGLQPKLLDFGVVKVLDRRREGITAAGAIVGSPAFLSPEQARGEASVDERSDAWSFCVTIYLCLTGRLPFTSRTYHRLVRSILEEEPPSIEELGVPEPALWRILRRGLAKSIDERWPTMRELGAALAGWLLEQGIDKDACDNDLVSEWHASDEPKSRIVLRADAAAAKSGARARRIPWRIALAAAGVISVAAGSLALWRSPSMTAASLTPASTTAGPTTEEPAPAPVAVPAPANAVTVVPLPQPPAPEARSTAPTPSLRVAAARPAESSAPPPAERPAASARARSTLNLPRPLPLPGAAETSLSSGVATLEPPSSRAPAATASAQRAAPAAPSVNQDLINPYEEDRAH